MEQTLSPEPSKVSLETIPPEIRNQIYGCLLDTKSCDKSKDINGNLKPKFCPNILRVNKKIYKEAHGILYAANGPVVTVVFYMHNTSEALDEGLVPYYPTRYTRSIAGRRLHVIVRPSFVSVAEREPFAFVLVGMESIKKFARFLKFLNWSENDGRGISYEFNFEPCNNVLQHFETTSGEDSQVQKALVNAFSNLRASVQTCTSKGLVDPKLESVFLEKLNDRIIWLLAEAYERYAESLALYNKACKLLVDGSFDAALRHYTYILISYANSMETNPLLQRPDASLSNSLGFRIFSLVTLAQTSRALIYILGTFSDDHKDKLENWVCETMFRRMLRETESIVSGIGGAMSLVMVPPKVHSIVWQVIAVLRAINDGGAAHVARAYEMAAAFVDGADEMEQKKLEGLMKLALYGKPQAPSTPRYEIIQTLADSLPFPLVHFDQLAPVKSTTALNERHILQKVKYTGPYYWDSIESIPTHSDSGEQGGIEVDLKHCENLMKDLAFQFEKVKDRYQVSAWIGANSFYFMGSNQRLRDAGTPIKNLDMGYPFYQIRLPF